MSMNLIFQTKNGEHFEEFPFQTPTNMTYAVLAEKTKEKQLDIIKSYTFSLFNDDTEFAEMVLEEIQVLMNDDKLELSLI